MDNTVRLKPGMIVKHFKKDGYLARLDHEPSKNDMNTYTYRILHIGQHTETKEKLVIYQAMYTNESMGVTIGNVYCRPYDMFMSEVDRDKYPNVMQKYRFEQILNY